MLFTMHRVITNIRNFFHMKALENGNSKKSQTNQTEWAVGCWDKTHESIRSIKTDSYSCDDALVFVCNLFYGDLASHSER